MQRTILIWPLIILFSAIGAFYALAVEPGSPFRLVATLWFLLICPGMAFVRLLRLANPLIEWTLAITASLALDAVIANVLVYNTVWLPPLALLLLIAISFVGASLQLLYLKEVAP